MRVKIAQQGVGDTAQAISPGLQAGDAVDADAQNLGMDPFEPVEDRLVRRDLARSYRRPGQGKESQHDIALAVKVAQRNGLPGMAFKREIRSGDSNG